MSERMGRPKGRRDSKPRVTAARKQAEIARSRGLSPLDVLLAAMREAWIEAERLKAAAAPAAEVLAMRHVACEKAVQAAPYCHPRLAVSAINVKADVSTMSPAERDQRIAELLAKQATRETRPMIEGNVTNAGAKIPH
jgi:hypothetical protein